MIEVIESALQKAAGEGMDEFIQVFTDKYKEVIGGELTADTMPLLTGEQHSCLLYTSPSPRDRQKSRMPSSA